MHTKNLAVLYLLLIQQALWNIYYDKLVEMSYNFPLT